MKQIVDALRHTKTRLVDIIYLSVSIHTLVLKDLPFLYTFLKIIFNKLPISLEVVDFEHNSGEVWPAQVAQHLCADEMLFSHWVQWLPLLCLKRLKRFTN